MTHEIFLIRLLGHWPPHSFKFKVFRSLKIIFSSFLKSLFSWGLPMIFSLFNILSLCLSISTARCVNHSCNLCHSALLIRNSICSRKKALRLISLANFYELRYALLIFFLCFLYLHSQNPAIKYSDDQNKRLRRKNCISGLEGWKFCNLFSAVFWKFESFQDTPLLFRVLIRRYEVRFLLKNFRNKLLCCSKSFSRRASFINNLLTQW